MYYCFNVNCVIDLQRGKTLYNIPQEATNWYNSASEFTFDCVYSYLWSNIGIIWLVLICLCFFVLARRRNPRISLCLIFWALYGMSEITVMSIVRFFPLVLISTLFLSREESARLYGPEKPASPGWSHEISSGQIF